ncbi:MAG TPA: DUF4446 family protein [Actinomycetota bacterium]|nr:DUF4446 family protein [Actinomycetota bacterium]
MVLSPQTLSILVVVSLGLAALAVFLVVASAPRRTGRRPRAATPGEALAAHEHAIDELKRVFRGLQAEQRRQAEQLLVTIGRVGLVRYDAFEDMGGHLSFSAALLDEQGDGLVVTSINGRQDTRCYAKPVERGTSRYNLSAEEEEAVRQALASRRELGAPVEVPPRRGRRITSRT